MINYSNVTDKDKLLLRWIASSPDDCLITKTSKDALKRLINACLIEVETRRCEPWSVTSVPYSVAYVAGGYANHLGQVPTPDEKREAEMAMEEGALHLHRHRSLRTWLGRTEVYAKLTEDGIQWVNEERVRHPLVLAP